MLARLDSETHMNSQNDKRCPWCGTDPVYVAYHDKEWGVPLKNEKRLFEMLILEGAQAGLSWITVLKKRPRYREVFDGFDVQKIARYDQARVNALMQDAGIIRNRLKIEATIGNARAYLALRESGTTLRSFLWRFVDGQPRVNHWKSMKQIPANTPLSDAMSKALKQRGFKFVGTTICYAYMQSIGMVNDHLTTCYRHAELAD